MLYTTYSIAQTAPISTTEEPINGLDCFDTKQMADLAEFKRACDRDKLDLLSYKEVITQFKSAEPWWKSPTFIISGCVVSLSLGAIIGIAISKK